MLPKFLLDTLAAEWNVLKNAPVSVITLIVIMFLTGVAVCAWHYSKIIDGLTAQITAKEQQSLEKDIRIATKEELLSDARERLKLEGAAGSRFSRMSNRDLQGQALRVVSEIRDMVAKIKSQETLEANKIWEDMRRTEGETQKNLSLKHMDVYGRNSDRIMNIYKSKYKIDIIMMLDEILTRLPGAEITDRVQLRYEHLVNPNGINLVIDDLERRAKMLK